jgi:uncharacterized membrane protein (GlpM family)
MNVQKVLPVVISVVVIVLVALVQERSRYLAALLAVMPLSAPLAMWIIFSASGGDYQQTADFVLSMVLGLVATVVFVLASWLGLRQRWPFAAVVAFAFAVWGLIVAAPHLLRRIF